MSDENPTCCAKAWTRERFPRSYICGNRAKVQEGGKWYCGIHDPAKRRATEERWKREQEEQEQKWRIRDAAHKCLEYCVAHIDEMPAELRAEIAKAYPDLKENRNA